LIEQSSTASFIEPSSSPTLIEQSSTLTLNEASSSTSFNKPSSSQVHSSLFSSAISSSGKVNPVPSSSTNIVAPSNVPVDKTLVMILRVPLSVSVQSKEFKQNITTNLLNVYIQAKLNTQRRRRNTQNVNVVVSLF